MRDVHGEQEIAEDPEHPDIAFVDAITSNTSAPGNFRLNDDAVRIASVAFANERSFCRSSLCSFSKPSRLKLIDDSPALTSELNRSRVIASEFVTIPHLNPRFMISRPASSKSARSSGSPPVMQTVRFLYGLFARMSSRTRAKSATGMSGTPLVERQSLPQWRQRRLHLSVHSQKR